MVAEWLRVEIVTGLQKLLALRLIGTPPEDAIVGTAEVWLEAVEHCGVQWSETLDRERVRRSFRTLYRICDRWPAPKVFLDNLGNRDPPKALPEPPITREVRERNRAKLREIVRSLAKSKQMSERT
ncbi:hypothetical protein HCX48_00425 [Rhodocyclus tenuis]|uniref:Uncharacterized protein n=1 Tax=Rhodocyclus gracilis TaxID=2929842 RepID=A0ABX0WDE1_9RHOO|nr:hypothetical protein [Rhodocyclus gracilis]MRD73307.1 hypothetical protein [Rhodocyclus gracilis]NJA87692.1 hypothetical protein [Rhodocyclus gracilis]